MNKYVITFSNAPYDSIKDVYGFTLSTFKYVYNEDPILESSDSSSYIEFETSDENFNKWEFDLIHGNESISYYLVDATLTIYDRDENIIDKYALHGVKLNSVNGRMLKRRSEHNDKKYIVRFDYKEIERIDDKADICENNNIDLDEIKAACKLFKTVEKYASETIPLISDLNLDDDDLLCETFTSEFNRNIDKQKEVLTKRIIELINNLD